jgi:hypothetical protein
MSTGGETTGPGAKRQLWRAGRPAYLAVRLTNQTERRDLLLVLVLVPYLTILLSIKQKDDSAVCWRGC